MPHWRDFELHGARDGIARRNPPLTDPGPPGSNPGFLPPADVPPGRCLPRGQKGRDMTQRKSDRATEGQMTRRDVLRLGVTAAAGVAVGPFVVTPARAQSFNWQRFKGKEIFMMLYKHPWVDEMLKNLPEFESLTGIKV